jgi:hypothetical protein
MCFPTFIFLWMNETINIASNLINYSDNIWKTLIISLIFNYFLILPFLLKMYCINFTSNRSQKKLLSSLVRAASITLYFKTFYLVIMKLLFYDWQWTKTFNYYKRKFKIECIQKKQKKKYCSQWGSNPSQSRGNTVTQGRILKGH